MKNAFDIRNLRDFLLQLEEEKKKEKNQLGTPVPAGKQPAGAPLASNVKAEKPAEKEEVKVPTVTEDKAPAENFADLTDTVKSEEGKEVREEVRETANGQFEAGNERSESAAAKNDALYEALLAFTGKQDGRYDELLAAILAGDPSKSEAGRTLLARYAELGERAAGHAAAESAAANGGNPDSYAAAQAQRALLDFAAAGEDAAAALYGEQLDRALAALGASGKDMATLFGLTQDNVGEDTDLANLHIGTGEGLFSSLLDAVASADKTASDTLSELFDEVTDGKYLGNISPMQIDEEYANLTSVGGGGHSMREAMLILWDKYPTMRAYIMDKYTELTKPTYSFVD